MPRSFARLVPLTLLPVLVLAASLANARPPGERGHRGPPPIDRVLERHAERLGLEDAVRDEIRRIAAESRDESEPVRERLRELRKEMRSLLAAETPDESRVMEQAERIGAADVELEKHRLRATLRIRALLTKQQRDELVKIHDERRERRGSPRRHDPSDEPHWPKQ